MSRSRSYAESIAKDTPLRLYEITTPDGEIPRVNAHYCFNNNDDGRGLILRRYVDDNARGRTYVVAEFAPGHWARYREIPYE